jgi:Zn-dependent protease
MARLTGGTVGNFTRDTVILAAELAVSLLVAMIAREYARARVASRLHDPTPRLWGRLTLNPRSWFDPFGCGLLPGLVLVLWAAGASFLPPPVAYAKPAPIDPSYFRRRTRDSVLVGLAGPLTNVALAAVAGLLLRGVTLDLEIARAVVAFEFTNLCLAIFHLLPIPGLDGARLVALALPPHAAAVFRNADKYLALIVMGVLFLLSGVLNSIVYSLTNALCTLFSGFGCGP